jgi:hypothetical protein
LYRKSLALDFGKLKVESMATIGNGKYGLVYRGRLNDVEDVAVKALVESGNVIVRV